MNNITSFDWRIPQYALSAAGYHSIDDCYAELRPFIIAMIKDASKANKSIKEVRITIEVIS